VFDIVFKADSKNEYLKLPSTEGKKGCVNKKPIHFLNFVEQYRCIHIVFKAFVSFGLQKKVQYKPLSLMHEYNS